MRKEYDFSRGKRGPVIASPGKTRITIMIDDDVIEAFRAKAETAGRGYQTLINEVLRATRILLYRVPPQPLSACALHRLCPVTPRVSQAAWRSGTFTSRSTCTPIAQMKPSSSRPTAVIVCCLHLPRAMSRT